MKLLNNVLIKLIRGGFTDRVLYLDNVPEAMFYELQYPRHCVGKGQEQHYEPDMTKDKIMTLYPELVVSQTGDQGIVFDMENEHGKNRYLALDRFIKMSFSATKVPAEPVVNSVDPMDSAAAALALSVVPRVVLPVLSPPDSKDSGAGNATASLDVEKIRQDAIKEYQTETKEKEEAGLIKARANRRVKTA